MIPSNMGSSGNFSRADKLTISVCGFFAVSLNILAIMQLSAAPSSYRPFMIDKWIEEIVKVPNNASISSLSFTIGVIALIPFTFLIAEYFEKTYSALIKVLIASGALMNAIGTVMPLIVVREVWPLCDNNPEACMATAHGFLAFALVMDSVFNFLFGLGLVFMGIALIKKPLFVKDETYSDTLNKK